MQKILKRIEQDSAPEYLRTNCLVSRHPLSSLAKRGFFCSCMNAWHLGFLPVAPPHCNGGKCASQRRHPIIIKRIKEPKKMHAFTGMQGDSGVFLLVHIRQSS